MQIGLSFGAFAAPFVPPTPSGTRLDQPANLYTAAQSDFTQTSNINLRNNWTVAQGDLRQIQGNGSTNDVRIDLDVPLVVGNPHIALWNTIPGTVGKYKSQFGGNGSQSGILFDSSERGSKFQWLPANLATGAFSRFGFNPTEDGLDVQITNVTVYDLGSIDPNTVACDVVLCLGDSNMANATSEFVTEDNLTTPFDPRVFYMPTLRASPSFSNTSSERHIPQPCIEPVQSAASAARMSPLQAFGARFAPWSAARGKPLLLLSLGDPGSGLMNTEDWRKSSTTNNTGSRMWNEMIESVNAMNALGPAHEIVGAIVSLGANDRFGGADADAYDFAHLDAYNDFFANVRADVADVPMVLSNIAPHVVDWFTTENPNPGFGPALQEWLNRFDQDSGHPSALDRFRVVQPVAGNALEPLPNNNPHYNAAGMQANGAQAADALLALLA